MFIRYGDYEAYCPVREETVKNVGFYLESEDYPDMPLGDTDLYARKITLELPPNGLNEGEGVLCGKYTRGEENMNKKMRKRSLLMLAVAVAIGLLGHSADYIEHVVDKPAEVASIDKIPEYEGSPYIIINENEPDFSEEELRAKPYEEYSPLDIWGRCREAEACVGPELMPEPDEERKSISSVEPTGWETENTVLYKISIYITAVI